MAGLIFDLDGTLIDSVYAHVLAWQAALAGCGVAIDCAKLHKRIGMSGELLMQESARDAGVKLSALRMAKAEARHALLFRKLHARPIPLTGAVKLLSALRKAKVAWGIATSGKAGEIAKSLRALGVVDGDVVVASSAGNLRAKPEPDLFLECARQLQSDPAECFVVGDAIWDVLAARRARIQAIGFTCGGYSEVELYQAGAFRVFSDPASLARSLGQLGIDA